MANFQDDDIIEGEILEESPGSGASPDVLEGEIVINRQHSAEDDAYDYVMRKGWWVLLLRGIVLSVIGLIALFTPDAALNLLALLIGVYIVFDSAIHLINGLRRRSSSIVRGLVGMGIGAIIIAYSSQLATMTSSAIVYVTAGILSLAAIIALLGALRGDRVRWVSLISGIILLVVGALMFVNPAFFTATFVRFIGFLILLGGIIVCVFALKLRQLIKQTS